MGAQKESKTNGMMPIVLPIKLTWRNRMFRNHAQDVPGEWAE